MPESQRRLRIAIPCSGLGHINRGFESFTQECFRALYVDPALEVTLYKGGGSASAAEVPLSNLRRKGAMAGYLGRLTGRGPYLVEQATFTAALLPRILLKKPDVIFFSDIAIGNALWHYRKRTEARFALVLSNGGPSHPAFERWDLVQQVSPEHMERDPATGDFYANQAMVPYGFVMPATWTPPAAEERAAWRLRFNLPLDRTMVVSVGAVQADLKRMDYVVQELARIPEQRRPFLLLLGNQDPVLSEPIKRLASELLRASDYAIHTVSRSDVTGGLRASDIFVLASLHEGFGRVYVEALAEGLPAIVHDYQTSRFVLGQHGQYLDLTKPGELARGIVAAEAELIAPEREDRMRQRHAYAREHFSWETLRPQYVAMMQEAFTRRAAKARP